MVFNGNTDSQMEHTILKSIKNWAEKRRQIVCAILFDLFWCVTSSDAEEKYWFGKKYSSWPL